MPLVYSGMNTKFFKLLLVPALGTPFIYGVPKVINLSLEEPINTDSKAQTTTFPRFIPRTVPAKNTLIIPPTLPQLTVVGTNVTDSPSGAIQGVEVPPPPPAPPAPIAPVLHQPNGTPEFYKQIQQARLNHLQSGQENVSQPSTDPMQDLLTELKSRQKGQSKKVAYYRLKNNTSHTKEEATVEQQIGTIKDQIQKSLESVVQILNTYKLNGTEEIDVIEVHASNPNDIKDFINALKKRLREISNFVENALYVNGGFNDEGEFTDWVNKHFLPETYEVPKGNLYIPSQYFATKFTNTVREANTKLKKLEELLRKLLALERSLQPNKKRTSSQRTRENDQNQQQPEFLKIRSNLRKTSHNEVADAPTIQPQTEAAPQTIKNDDTPQPFPPKNLTPQETPFLAPPSSNSGVIPPPPPAAPKTSMRAASESLTPIICYQLAESLSSKLTEKTISLLKEQNDGELLKSLEGIVNRLREMPTAIPSVQPKGPLCKDLTLFRENSGEILSKLMRHLGMAVETLATNLANMKKVEKNIVKLQPLNKVVDNTKATISKLVNAIISLYTLITTEEPNRLTEQQIMGLEEIKTILDKELTSLQEKGEQLRRKIILNDIESYANDPDDTDDTHLSENRRKLKEQLLKNLKKPAFKGTGKKVVIRKGSGNQQDVFQELLKKTPRYEDPEEPLEITSQPAVSEEKPQDFSLEKSLEEIHKKINEHQALLDTIRRIIDILYQSQSTSTTTLLPISQNAKKFWDGVSSKDQSKSDDDNDEDNDSEWDD